MTPTVRPLDGMRVLSLAVNVPGPVAVARLVELGATATKVEPPAGDPLAAVAPGWYAELHTGVAVRTLDLKSADGRAELDRLIADADVLVTASRPAAMARLGLDRDGLRDARPGLVTVAIVGESGSGAQRAGHDLTYLAEAGLLEPPATPRTLLADLSGAADAVTAALAGLLARARTGEGSWTEVALLDSVARLRAPLGHGLTATGGVLGGGWPLYDVYRAADGWVAVAALEEHFARRLLDGLGLEAPERAALERAFLTRPAQEWAAWAEERDLPLAVVR